MQVLLKTSFGNLFLWAYEIGTVDARGMVLAPVVSNSEDGPHSIVFIK